MKDTVVGTRSVKALDTRYRKEYGIGINQYKTMLAEQDGKCFLCGAEHWRNLAVDHNHTTGKIRRLLCTHCNMALGLLNDDPVLLQKCIDYVQTEFVIPDDIPVEPVKQQDKPRWRRIVFTPDGVFSSLTVAAKHYSVDNSTMGVWCGAYDYYVTGQKEGFRQEKVFMSLTELVETYNIKE